MLGDQNSTSPPLAAGRSSSSSSSSSGGGIPIPPMPAQHKRERHPNTHAARVNKRFCRRNVFFVGPTGRTSAHAHGFHLLHHFVLVHGAVHHAAHHVLPRPERERRRTHALNQYQYRHPPQSCSIGLPRPPVLSAYVPASRPCRPCCRWSRPGPSSPCLSSSSPSRGPAGGVAKQDRTGRVSPTTTSDGASQGTRAARRMHRAQGLHHPHGTHSDVPCPSRARSPRPCASPTRPAPCWSSPACPSTVGSSSCTPCLAAPRRS